MGENEEHEHQECEEEKDRIRSEYQEAMKNAVDFEKDIRNKWREKSKQKDERISKLEERVEELEQRLAES